MLQLIKLIIAFMVAKFLVAIGIILVIAIVFGTIYGGAVFLTRLQRKKRNRE